MFCTKCGNPLAEGVKYCTNCGNPVASCENENAVPVENSQRPAVIENDERTFSITSGHTGENMGEIPVRAPEAVYSNAPVANAVTPDYGYPANQWQGTNAQNNPVAMNVGTQAGVQPNYQNYGYSYNNGAVNTYASQPVYKAKGVSFGTAIKLYFVNYANFRGRASKSEYWWAFLFYALVATPLSFIPFVGAALLAGFIVPSLAIGARRLHDIGKHGTYLLMGLIPFAGAIILLVQFLKSSEGDNQWGPANR